MDCAICVLFPSVLRSTRTMICPSCLEGARSLITFVSTKLEKGGDGTTDLSKGFPNALRFLKEMKERENDLNDKLIFLGGSAEGFKERTHTDIKIMPGEGLPIPAHRALLAARSNIFKNMLESDGCKAPPSETISLPELNHEELESLLEFLYCGTLPTRTLEKHVYTLYTAADKYNISFLQKFCENHLLQSLSLLNVLDVLEIADVCSNTTLKESAMVFIVKHMDDIVFSSMYDTFALKNPHLNVEITRTLLMEIKNKRIYT
ncbi:hypothetical protein GIB67_020228 [Kingdonia uniflora]|uniref:BTB domain-containing protein n=1 Tax=Kingdonia uniflora TaxID=39325 RepID=A0A7J7P3L3_9MAGN|nr:hypothetical protein GIB67_020228 [Kingdonia uniflora]